MKDPAWVTEWVIGGTNRAVTVRAPDESTARKNGFLKVVERFGHASAGTTIFCVSVRRLRGASRRRGE